MVDVEWGSFRLENWWWGAEDAGPPRGVCVRRHGIVFDGRRRGGARHGVASRRCASSVAPPACLPASDRWLCFCAISVTPGALSLLTLVTRPARDISLPLFVREGKGAVVLLPTVSSQFFAGRRLLFSADGSGKAPRYLAVRACAAATRRAPFLYLPCDAGA